MVTCVFCGQPLVDGSREHVVPQWLAEELGLSKEFILPTHFSEAGEVLSDRSHPVNQYLCGRVCAKCNHGWMSSLETANKTAITGLVHGKLDTVDLQDSEAELLATWAAKTAFALHAASNYRRIVPDAHYRLMAERQIVPPLVWVIGKRWPSCSGFSWAQSTSWTIVQRDRDITDREISQIKAEAYKICFQIGQMILLVASNPVHATRCCLWKFGHVPLHPRRGPVSWILREPSLPTDSPAKACFAFSHALGLVTVSEDGRLGPANPPPP